MTITSAPRMTPGRWAPMTCPGSSITLCQAVLLDLPPSNTWVCCRAIVIPMPASIACTTTGEIASAARATRLSPNATCRTPAARVMKHVTAQPKSEIRSAAGSSMTLCQAVLFDLPPSSTWVCCRAIVIPMPASIACTTTGEIASAARATRLSPNATCRTPAATVMKHVTAQPNSETRSATTTVRPAAGPLTCSGDPPMAPAMTPPTIAAIRPASTGALDAIAIPSDNGSATRNTTSDAGKSYRRTDRSRSDCIGELPR